MDINSGLLSERLRKLLAGEEVTLPDAVKEEIKKLHAEIEIVISCQRDYGWDIAWTMLYINNQEDLKVGLEHVKATIDETIFFAYESEKVIDTHIINITQQSSQTGCKDICDALLGLQSRIIDIRQRTQQLQHIRTPTFDGLKLFQFVASFFPASSSSKKRDTVCLDDSMEELLDLLIEGSPQLSVIAVVDSIGLDKTAFAAEAYSSSYAKHYFDCHAWLQVPFLFHSEQLLDLIVQSLIHSSRWTEIRDKNYEMKKMILHDYLQNKRYLIVFDQVLKSWIWGCIRELLPDNQNGSRVLITLTNVEELTSFQLENGESIPLNLVPPRGPLRVTYQGWPFHLIYHGSMSFEENLVQSQYIPLALQIYRYFALPFSLKICSLYLYVFPVYYEISTRQLYQLWIAEGFIPDNNEGTAEKYLEQLISIGIVQAKKRRAGGTINTCSLSGHWISVLLMVGFKSEFIYFDALDPECELRKNAKRLSDSVNQNPLNSLDGINSHLHSLLCFSSESHQIEPVDCKKICKMFKFLRVLDLRSLVLKELLSEFENLFFLRYLELNIPRLEILPSSFLSNLPNLYTLDMAFSCVDHTADVFWEMNKLRHLNFGLITLPESPRNDCGSLENINFISALHPCCCTRDILGRLPNLRNLQIWGDLSYYQSLLSKSLYRLSCLKSLKLVNKSQKPRLSKIILGEYQFPLSLTHLSFSDTELMEDPMPTLEKLPVLQVLKLKENSYLGRKLTCGSDGFPKLKVLHLKSMLWLDEWTMGIGAMPKLECLTLNPCAYLRRLPEQLWSLKRFNKLELWWPQPELRQKLRDIEDKEQYNIQLYPFGI